MDSKRDKDISEKSVEKDRRSFLKKAVYAAPALTALGALSRPTSSQAGESVVPDGPGTGGTGWTP